VKLTRLGIGVIVVLVVCVLLAVFASGAPEAAGLVIAALIVLVLAGEGLTRGGAGSYRRKQEVLTREAEEWRKARR
jgi:hypothetical protein